MSLQSINCPQSRQLKKALASERNISEASLPTVVTSDSVCVKGFQIKTNTTDSTEVGFRTAYETLNVGSVIMGSDGKENTVAKMSTIYTLDPNYNRYRKIDVLNPSYTILNPNMLSGAGVYTGAKTANISVSQIADYLYKNSKATNFTGLKYLYNNVLNKVETTNPYYRDTTLSYGWNSQLYISQNPTFTITEGTLDSYNNIP